MNALRVLPGHQLLDKRDQKRAKTVKVSLNCLLFVCFFFVQIFCSFFCMMFVCFGWLVCCCFVALFATSSPYNSQTLFFF